MKFIPVVQGYVVILKIIQSNLQIKIQKKKKYVIQLIDAGKAFDRI